jgi:AbrB family looped-hinge helix DNA binding protein
MLCGSNVFFPQNINTPKVLVLAGAAMEEILRVDERGRLTIPKVVREKVGIKGFLIIEVAGDHLKLKPLKDKFADLEGSLTSSLSFEELRNVSEQQLVKEAVERFRKRHQ